MDVTIYMYYCFTIYVAATPALDYNRMVNDPVVTYQRRNSGGRICRTISIINDNQIESIESFRVILRPVNRFGVDVRFMPSSATVTIMDDDSVQQPGTLIGQNIKCHSDLELRF